MKHSISWEVENFLARCSTSTLLH